MTIHPAEQEFPLARFFIDFSFPLQVGGLSFQVQEGIV
ncbi:MAG: hypothetical protein CEN91_313 [Candidatus Berkelbacteria bacterium Licking1014_85]|uniref:Uncharacterized protein n=1 Tax=Candidatus Berkelbacteria bacterium Licking1014_85 TaxID=2017148 RepID=A0A554LJJ4_9BACT|nr:MAG: hypothetical protein CEN91_313 [Candidatus Berkelbacteria bacterium Licking1014_85]